MACVAHAAHMFALIYFFIYFTLHSHMSAQPMLHENDQARPTPLQVCTCLRGYPLPYFFFILCLSLYEQSKTKRKTIDKYFIIRFLNSSYLVHVIIVEVT